MAGFFNKSDNGFLPNSKLKRYKPLPPRMQIKFPPEKKKEVSVKSVPVSKIPQMVLDIECYWNYFLVKLTRVSDGAVYDFEMTRYQKLDYDRLEAILNNAEIVTFNGNTYDILILRYALTGANNRELKIATNDIIQKGLSPYNFEEKYDLPKLKKLRHIDIVGLLPGMAISLKLYGGRLHCMKMQDLPIGEDEELSEEDMDDINTYCGNDLAVTLMLFASLAEQVELRRMMSKRYGVDLMSKSDAQIAEEVIKSEILKSLPKGSKLKKPEIRELSFYYKAPEFIQFVNPTLIQALDITENNPFEVGTNGRITMPKELQELKIKIGSSVYNMGMGGLHSQEKRAFHIADDMFEIFDWDADSYYPMIVLICGLFPKRLGKIFLKIFEGIVNERLDAKFDAEEFKKASEWDKYRTAKSKADSLKIVVNGSFGKFGSPYSVLYSPELMIQVTLTGQLSLLMLIDTMERRGIHVVSGNTDGIVIKCPKDKLDIMHSIINWWQKKTGFKMSKTQYAGIFSRDINNYLAVKLDGEVKSKGIFSSSRIGKNPENEICNIAMIEYLKYGTHFEDTIKACKDITKFVTVRSVQGGAIKHYDKGTLPYHRDKEELCKIANIHPYYDGTWLESGKEGMSAMSLDSAYRFADKKLRTFKQTIYLGKAIRFYHAKGETSAIYRRTNGDQVAGSEGAKPIMDLSVPFPNDIDYEYYVDKCKEMF
jgi:hypothetical protein